MKRWFVILLVLLAVIVLVSPGIVGRLAEQNLESSLGWAEHESDDIVVTEQTFDRRWFTSEGRYRIEFRNGDLQAKIAGPSGADDGTAPALIVNTHIDHGLIPVTSMSRESGSLQPGLASAVSTLQFDPGNGKVIAIPGKLYSQVGLSGETHSRFLLESGAVDNETWDAEWNGADIIVVTDPSDLSIGFEGSIEPLSVTEQGEFIRIGKVQLKGKQTDSGYGFSVGSIELEMDSLAFGTPAGDAGQFGKVTLKTSTEIDDGRTNSRMIMNVADGVLPNVGEFGVAMDVAVNGVDAGLAQAIIETLREGEGPGAPETAFADIYPQIESNFQKLLSAGAEIRFDRFDFMTPHGEVTSNLNFDLPATDVTDFTWPSLLLALTASADVRVPAALVEMAQSANPQAGSLVAMGILKKDGAFYAVNAEYAKGLLTVNGAPMPIPLPGQ